MDINSFTNDLKNAIEEFKDFWLKNNKIDPEVFPLEFDKDNDGAWVEQFLMFMSMRDEVSESEVIKKEYIFQYCGISKNGNNEIMIDGIVVTDFEINSFTNYKKMKKMIVEGTHIDPNRMAIVSLVKMN